MKEVQEKVNLEQLVVKEPSVSSLVVFFFLNEYTPS